jgi:hypothetical protein
MPQGVDFGEKERINFIGRRPKMSYPAEARFAAFITRVNAILAEYPAFRGGENCRFVDNGHSAIIAAFRRAPGHQSPGFLVACNFDTVGSQRIYLDLADALQWDGPFACRELLSSQTRVFPHACMELLLPACGAQVLLFPVP